MLHPEIGVTQFYGASLSWLEYKQVNAAFQASSPSIGDQHALLLTLYNSMKDWVYAKSGEETNLAEIDYGYKFIHELYKINLSEHQKTDIR